MKPIKVTLTLAAASANNIAQAQTPGGAGNLTLNGSAVSGGVATLDVARRVRITTVANESAKTLTIYGTDRNGNTISETMTGPNATTGDSLLDYKTVTQIAVSAAFTNTVTAGTGPKASTPWINFVNRYDTPVDIGFAVQLSSGASLTYDVEHTFAENMATSLGPFDVMTHETLGAQTTTQDGNYAFGATAMRATITAYTSGTLTLYVNRPGK